MTDHSIHIRTMSEADLPAAGAILRTAGWPMHLDDLNLDRRLQRDGYFIAEVSDVPVGVIGCIDYTAFGVIGMLAVDPSLQRQHIGHTLLEHALAWLRGRGVEVAVVEATQAAVHLCEQLGFRVDHDTVVMARSGSSKAAPPGSRLRPMTAANLPDVAALDAPIFGADRTRVLAALLERNPGRGFIARDADGDLVGYALGRRRRLGPIVATERAAAQGLINLALNLPYEGPPTIALPAINTAGLEMLTAQGFKVQRTLKHMRRGGDGPVGDPTRIYALSDPAVG